MAVPETTTATSNKANAVLMKRTTPGPNTVGWRLRSDISESPQPARAVSDRFSRDAHVFQNGEVQVRQGRSLRETDVAAAFDARSLPADERDRQIVVEMRIAVADAGAVQEQR